MTAHRTIVVLTDGEQNLAHYMDLLRDEGWRVLATARPYEAALWVARQDVGAFIARSGLIPDRNGDFLRQVRDFHPRPFTIVLHPAREPRVQPSPVVDLTLHEPFGYGDLLQALETGVGRLPAPLREAAPEPTTVASQPVRRGGGAGSVRPTASRASLPKIYQVVNACRILTELERDREALLTQALELFVDVTDSQRGSIMLRSHDGSRLEVVRRIGFPPDAPDGLAIEIGSEIAGSVLVSDEPLLVEDAVEQFPDRPHDRYDGRSFLVVPITNRQATLGVVNLTNKRGGESYTRDDLIRAMMLADQTAVTLANANTLVDLHEMTVIDPLTHLYNRRHFDRELRKEIERARRYGRQLTLALLDIDNFKLFNDLNGYVTGDRILKLVAKLIRSSFREADIVTRWGGDEFAVLLPETGRPTATANGHRTYIDRVRSAVEKADFSGIGLNQDARITLSIGVATFPVDSVEEADLFRKANRALKRAKRLGTNRTCFADELEEEAGA